MTPTEMEALDDALREAGDFGRVVVVKRAGRIDIVEVVRSLKVRDPRQEELPMT